MTGLAGPVWLSRKLWAISIAETIAWAGLFYIFPASLLRWQSHYGWSITQLSFGLTEALIVSALVGIVSGKLIDRGHGRLLISLTVIVGGLALSILPVIETLWQFYLVWLVIGAAMGGCLYDPCFALLTRNYGLKAKGPIVMITFFAGLSITVSFSLTTVVSNYFNWEASILVFSFLLCCISGPFFWYGTSESSIESSQRYTRKSGNLNKTLQYLLPKPIFWGLTVMFSAIAINHVMLISQILPILESKGATASYSVLVASLMGPMQVFGRMSLIGMERIAKKDFPTIQVSVVSSIILCISSLALFFADSFWFLMILFLIFQGASFGIMNIVKPVITAELLGQANFGVISSIVGIGYIWGFALAPGLAGAISGTWGYDMVIKTTFIVALIGLVSLAISLFPGRRNRQSLLP